MIAKPQRDGFSLLELMAALIIAASLAALTLHHIRKPSLSGKQHSCDLTREVMQDYADRYVETIGRSPSADLRELATAPYAGPSLPTCPVTGQSYRLDRNGIVGCPTHESTR
jgi:competence protein ComGC